MECFTCGNPATHECSCISSPIYFCSICISSHVISSLNLLHNIQEINSKSINPLCYDCKSKFCEVICLCKRIGLCKSCLVSHITQPGSHFIDFIRIEKQSRDTFDMDKKPGDNVKNEVSENIRHLEEFKERVSRSKQQIIDAITKAADELMQSAETSKKKMESALESIKTSRVPHEDQWPYNFRKRQGSMTPSRRNMSREIKLCETELNTDPIFKTIANFGKITVFGEINQAQEVNLYFFKPKARELVCIEASTFYVVKKIFPRTLSLPEAGSWCEGPSKHIIFCGGCKATGFTSEVFLIDPISLNFRPLPNMKNPRAMAAVTFINNVFYAFGGYSGSNLSSCEKFDFNVGHWENLPDMPVSRSAFTIATVGSKMYINGESNRLDYYDIEKNEFVSTEILVPVANYSSLAAFGENLILFQNDGCWSIELKSKKTSQIIAIPNGKWWSSFPPFVNGNNIVLARSDDGYMWNCEPLNRNISKKYKLNS